MSGRLLPAVLAVLAAVAAWLTPGLQAVVDADTRARVGGLPAWWLLAALVAGFAGAVLGRRLPAGRLWPLALTAFVCLPWLPGAVPPAFLIWQGPMATLVWILVAIGLAAPFASRRARPSSGGCARAFVNEHTFRGSRSAPPDGSLAAVVRTRVKIPQGRQPSERGAG